MSNKFMVEMGNYISVGDDPSWWQTLLRGLGAGATAAAGSVMIPPGGYIPPGCIPNPQLPGQYICQPQSSMLGDLLPWLIGGGVLWYVMKKRG